MKRLLSPAERNMRIHDLDGIIRHAYGGSLVSPARE